VSGKKPIAAMLYQVRRAFYSAFFITFLIDMMSLAPVLYMESVFDRVLSTNSGITLATLTILVVICYLFWSALEWVRSRMFVRLSLRIDWDLSSEIFDASYRRYIGHRNVNVHQLLNELTTLRQFLTGEGLITVMDIPFGVIFLFVGLLIHPILAAFIALAILLMVISTYFTSKVTSPILKEATDANNEATRVASNSLRQAETTMALGMLGSIRLRWHDNHKRFLHDQVHASEATGLMGGISGFLQKVLPSLQMGLGAYLAIEGVITGGQVAAASMLIGKCVAPLQKMITKWKDLVAAKQAYDHLNELLETDVKNEQQMKLPPVVGKLVVDMATIVPPGSDKAVLSDVNFTVMPGQALAIVGPSAAGKTCLVRSLLGIWKPSKGSIRLDGVDLSLWDHSEVGPQMGYVPQDIEFMDGTVSENIARLGTVDPERVVDAAKFIGMHETILSFPKGYDTLLGETGFVLSGGQKQRLAIARALYGNPNYIVMDEPNANLDEAGESVLAQVIHTLKQKKVSVIITTHRPRLVGVVDNLLVLRNGRQVGFGPADEMINAVRNLQVIKKQSDETLASQDATVVTGHEASEFINPNRSPEKLNPEKPMAGGGEA
jgi:ATP-binding cassette subfamily C exporter for protease/lipase/ATP-binding cassette subfamily C protein EexD